MIIRVLFPALLTLALIMTSTSCSLPSLETAACAGARNSVKRFYSLHFANELNPNAEYLKAREELLSGPLRDRLSEEQDEDYFTKTQDFPKAFRVGTCESHSEQAALQVVLLWRDDVRNDQSEVSVNVIRVGSDWLIDSVGN